MKSAVTLCRVSEAASGPFVFHDELAIGFEKAAAHGFDAVELFLPSPDDVTIGDIRELQKRHQLDIAALGTGAGMVKHGLSLTDADATVRKNALDFILALVDLGGALGAPAILGSMQGKHGPAVDKPQALEFLAEALVVISARAADHGLVFFYEPLNRYETNLFNRLAPAAAFLEQHGLCHVKLLADLFHMNIEETSLADCLTENFASIGHIHFADSNRQAIGFGHTNPLPILQTLQQLGYKGYLSAEIHPLPTPDEAARQFIRSINLPTI